MQSGTAANADWVLEYELETPRRPENLMGWVAAGDTLNQVRMRFASREAAEAFAQSKGMTYSVATPHSKKVRPQSYLDNFKFRPHQEEK
jgi:hypothetical protein